MQDKMQDNTPTLSNHPKRQWQVPQIRLLTPSATAGGNVTNWTENQKATITVTFMAGVINLTGS